MRTVSEELCRENQNTHFIFNNLFPKKSVVYEIMWKNVVEPEGPQAIENGSCALYGG